jgi:hypothetical protein
LGDNLVFVCVLGKIQGLDKLNILWVLWKTLSSCLEAKMGVCVRDRSGIPIELGIGDFTDEGKRYAQESNEERLEEFTVYY